MRVLMVHNYYQHRGGEGISFKAEVEALQALGHEVEVYTLDNAVDLPKMNPLRIAVRTIWSLASYRAIRKLLKATTYDVVHVQNFFPLISPSVYDAARSCGVPVVQTLRNYRLFCMQTGLFRDGAICEECPREKRVWPGIRHACYRGSRSASVVHGFMLVVHGVRKTWHRRVDGYVAISEFVKQKYVENGWSDDKVFVKHNTVSPDPGVGDGGEPFFVVAGRLAEDKGLEVLLDAWARVQSEWSGDERRMWRLKIVGDGPMLETLRETIKARALLNVVLMGRLPVDAVYDEMGRAAAVVQPSVRYEPFGRTIMEAYAKGTPVIAADIGGASELVDDGEYGFHFAPGDADELAERMLAVARNPEKVKGMRARAREKFEACFSMKKNGEELVTIYQAVCGGLKTEG